MSQLKDKWMSRASCPPSTGPVVISLRHVQGVLLLVPVGIGLATTVMGVEMVYRRSFLWKLNMQTIST